MTILTVLILTKINISMKKKASFFQLKAVISEFAKGTTGIICHVRKVPMARRRVRTKITLHIRGKRAMGATGGRIVGSVVAGGALCMLTGGGKYAISSRRCSSCTGLLGARVGGTRGQGRVHSFCTKFNNRDTC